MNKTLRNLLAVAGLALAAQASAQVTFYTEENFRGQSFTVNQQMEKFAGTGFNNRVSSVVVTANVWEVCEDARFAGRCVVLRPGRYASLAAMGLSNSVSSIRGARAAQESGPVIFYTEENFRGQSFAVNESMEKFAGTGFNNRVSSVVVTANVWEVCEDVRFAGRCVVLRPGRYASLAAMGLNNSASSIRNVTPIARVEPPRPAPPPPRPAPPPPYSSSQITLFEGEGFQGRYFTATRTMRNFRDEGFNNRASSIVVLGESWEVCEGRAFTGNCFILRPGRYPTLRSTGLNNDVSSARMVNRNTRYDDNRYAPPPAPIYDGRRRPNERLYEAEVRSVRAVLATSGSGQQCWIEREQVVVESRDNTVPGAVLGAIIGGILGHQVGGGSGRDIATAGGVVAGAVVGGNVGRNSGGGQEVVTQDVQRCQTVPGEVRPAYWDVIYNFRGQDHSVQMVSPPGRTITVNERGEPRG